MKKNLVKILVFVLILTISVVCLIACNKDNNEDENPAPVTGETYTVQFDLNYTNPTGSVASQTVASGAKVTEPVSPARENFQVRGWYKEDQLTTLFDFATETITEDITLYAGWTSTLYYVGGGFTGYEAAIDGFQLDEIPGKDGWFSKTVELTEDVRDTTYDGHYYKITNGTWDASGCLGTDNYALQPAPVSPTGAGLGSIWIYENCTLTIYFDSINEVIYDNSMVRDFANPFIYGDFNAIMNRGSDWSTEAGEALALTDPDGDGIFTGLYKIPAYTGANDGYSMAVAISEKYFIDQWGNRWGMNEQYKFDGTAAGMAGTSTLEVTEEAIYEFKYNSNTNITSVEIVEAGEIQNLDNPTIYGDFSNWLYEGSNAITLTDTDNDGLYVGFKKLPAYSGTSEDGYMLAVGLSKILYDDQWGIRWGMNEQYKFDGTAAGMAGTSTLEVTEETIYEFKYDSNTHITTVTAVEAGDVQNLANPTVYGDFTNWEYDGGNAFTLTDSNLDGVYERSIELDAYTGEGDGYMLAIGISKILYDDQWGIRWGMNEQYKFDGTAAGMAGTSYLKPTEDTTYLLSYDSNTHITTVTVE